MTTADVILDRETEEERIFNWRLEGLERAGYDAWSARTIAERSDVDLHVAVAIARGGCPSETALKILL